MYTTELIDRQTTWTRRAEVEREIAAWVHWYNTNSCTHRSTTADRPQPPGEYETRYRQTVASTSEVAYTRSPSDPGRFTSSAGADKRSNGHAYRGYTM